MSEFEDEVGRALSEAARGEWHNKVHRSDLARHNRRTARRGDVLGRPLAVWAADGCGCRVARLYLDPEGWHLIGDDYRIQAPEWLRRRGFTSPGGDSVTDWNGTPVTLDARDSGAVTFHDLRKVRGVVDHFPLIVGDHWPQPFRLPVGCGHGTGHLPIEDVMDAARAVRDARAAESGKRRVVLDKA